MAPSMSRKRKIADGRMTRPKKKFKKQREYHSSSEGDEDEKKDGDKPKDVPNSFSPVNREGSHEGSHDQNDHGSTHTKRDRKEKGFRQADQEADPDHREMDASESNDEDEDQGDDPSSDASPDLEEESDNDDDNADVDDDASDGSPEISNRTRHVPKRNDPRAFSTSMFKILSTKLSKSARADPALSRSEDAMRKTSGLADAELQRRAQAELRKKKLRDGRISDVLGIGRGQAGETAEEEKRHRKVAQRGVVKLFNAVRAAQVRGEEAAREERRKGTIGMEERKKAVNEVSKQSFLELINGKQGRDLGIEEA
ncbi:hypothetical protein Egran_02486 [Elaphomyces granulatus]|uniref:Rrp15p-domain-containing protein n=1 Tax=Elaphomyces granulatus TaxID=519963 RepID=A0A232M016_9EURO|nr:hypothetical protein Egran_02486 [Elaphomyces granulatus]